MLQRVPTLVTALALVLFARESVSVSLRSWRTCDLPPARDLPFCDHRLPLEQRVQDLIDRLTLEDRIRQLCNNASGVPALNIPEYQWWSEGLHGVADSPGVHFTGNTQYATSFPQVINTAATFNPRLPREIGSAIATEARAMSNQHNAGLTYWAPNINIFRDPRWGRGQETPGEDPYLSAFYAREFVQGMQEGDDPAHLKVSACCKHYAAYSLEAWGGQDRYHFNAEVSKRDEADTYLPAFHACVQEGRASSIMCSYNAVNGVPSCANHWLLTTMARDRWGFDGYITSDCGAVVGVYDAHHYTATPAETCAATLRAGVDIDCGYFMCANLAAALQQGVVTDRDVHEALRNLLRVRFRLGEFDPARGQPYLHIHTDQLNSRRHRLLALQAARESIVLLRNSGALPLGDRGRATLAVVGPHADATVAMQGNYYGRAPFLVSPLQGLAAYAASVIHARGCDVASNNTSGFADAQRAAARADATVLVLGLDQSQESEGVDRESLALPGVQLQLVDAVAAAARGPVVVAVLSGGAVDLTPLRDHPHVAALLWAGYPGQSGGRALAEVLFGDVNPAGRLPFTVYPAGYAQQVAMTDMNMRPSARSPGRTYRFYTALPVFAFGSGLSYTTFRYRWFGPRDRLPALPLHTLPTVPLAETGAAPPAGAAPSLLSGQPTAHVEVQVTNVGAVTGDDAVLVFLRPPDAGRRGIPRKYLVGFERVRLPPGRSVELRFPIRPSQLLLADEAGTLRAQPGAYVAEVGVGGNSIQRPLLRVTALQAEEA